MNTEASGNLAKGIATERPQEIRLALCPQFWPVSLGSYSIPGYCALCGFPGQLMIPTVEDYRERCTSGQFGQCLWFGVGEENAAAKEIGWNP